jgi:hypothetical protein
VRYFPTILKCILNFLKLQINVHLTLRYIQSQPQVRRQISQGEKNVQPDWDHGSTDWAIRPLVHFLHEIVKFLSVRYFLALLKFIIKFLRLRSNVNLTLSYNQSQSQVVRITSHADKSVQTDRDSNNWPLEYRTTVIPTELSRGLHIFSPWHNQYNITSRTCPFWKHLSNTK